MKIHEYQGKAVLKKYGVAVPRGSMRRHAKKPRRSRRMMASGANRSRGEGADPRRWTRQGRRREDRQVRGRSGRTCRKILGMKLVTHQTGPEGAIVHRLLIEETLPIEKELYLGILVDRGEGSRCSWHRPRAAWILSRWPPNGGSDPEAVHRPGHGAGAFQARKIAFSLGLKASRSIRVKFLTGLYRAFLDTDASLLRLIPSSAARRPFVRARRQVDFRRNALFRHPDLRELRDRHLRKIPWSGSVEVQPQLHQARWQRWAAW